MLCSNLKVKFSWTENEKGTTLVCLRCSRTKYTMFQVFRLRITFTRDLQETFVSKQLSQVSLFLFRNRKHFSVASETWNKNFGMCFGNKKLFFEPLFPNRETRSTFFASLICKQEIWTTCFSCFLPISDFCPRQPAQGFTLEVLV